MSKKVMIIGAGPGGLVTGMLLSHHGFNVHIYEKNAHVGGRNAEIILGDYHFDTGPTFFLMKDVLEYIFQVTGRNLHDYVQLTELSPMYRLRYGNDKELLMSRDKETMMKNLEDFSPGSANGYEKYLSCEKKRYDHILPCLSMPYLSPLSLLKKQFLRSLPYLDAHVSVFDVLARYYDDEKVRMAFAFQAKYLGMSPWKAPGTFGILSFIEHGGGVYHVQGGLSKLSDAMARVIEENGGSIHLSNPVKRILIKKKKAVGVELESSAKVMCDEVVINADFANAIATLTKNSERRKYSDHKLRTKK